jgi:transposase-like protein
MAVSKAWVIDELPLGSRRRECGPLAASFEPSLPESKTSEPSCGAPALLARTRRERQLAVLDVLTAHPDWADRRIGNLCGVSPRTVGRLRAELAENGGDSRVKCTDVRIGRDGRARPIDPTAQRARVMAALVERPDASLRDIARAVGVSPETVRSVRAALSERFDAPPTPAPVDFAAWRAAHDRSVRWEPDHSFTSRDDGAVTAQFLERTDVQEHELERHAGAVPLSRVYEVSDEARRRAAFWAQLAERVESRAKRRG